MEKEEDLMDSLEEVRPDMGFLEELREMWRLMMWVRAEFISEESKIIARAMLFVLIAAGVVGMVRIWSLSIVFNGLSLLYIPGMGFGPAFIVTTKGWFLFWFVSKVGSYLNLRAALKREKLFATNSGYIDLQVMEKFYNHSLSMHISEDSNLNEASVRKGMEHLTKIQSIVLFQGMEAMLAIIMPLAALVVLATSINSPIVIIEIGRAHV